MRDSGGNEILNLVGILKGFGPYGGESQKFTKIISWYDLQEYNFL
jgi:hypothetical protein